MKLLENLPKKVVNRANANTVQRVSQLAKTIVNNRPQAVTQRKLQEAFNKRQVIQRFPDEPESDSTHQYQMSPNGSGPDPAHQYWNDREQGNWNPRRFLWEGYCGIRGYATSHFRAPSLEPSPKVAQDPVRLAWHNQLVELRNSRQAPGWLMEQWIWQNDSQARGGNPLPVHAGQQMIEGAQQMGNATTLPELWNGYMHAQMSSLGGRGFTGGASQTLHRIAPVTQMPGMILRSMFTGVPSVTQSDFHPVRDVTRTIGSAYVSTRDFVLSRE